MVKLVQRGLKGLGLLYVGSETMLDKIAKLHTKLVKILQGNKTVTFKPISPCFGQE